MAELYNPLPPDSPLFKSRFFRLLSIDGSKRGGGRDYLLRIRPIEATTPYLALSYRWQEQKARQPITVNGKSVFIMQTVKDFLDLHLEKLDAMIFIDCICINQDDLDERASQVRLMGRIYSNAAKACLWLGNDLSLTDEYNLRVGSRLAGRYPGFYSGTRRAEVARKIFRKDFWTRAWIIQELLLPPRLDFYWGKIVLSEEEVHQLQTFAQLAFFGRLGASQKLTGIIPLMHRSLKDNGKGGLLLDQLKTFHWTEATDRRDKVYGLLGVAKEPADRGLLPIDYSPGNTLANMLCDLVTYFNVHAAFSAALIRLLVDTLDVGRHDVITDMRALQYAVEARGWIVAIVQEREGHPQHVSSESFFLAYNKYSYLEAHPEKEEDLPDDYQHVCLPTLGSQDFSTVDHAFSSTAEHRANHDANVRREGVDEMKDSSLQIYRCRAFPLAASSAEQPTERHEAICSRYCLEPGDVICRFDQIKIVFALRVSPSGAYMPVGTAYMSNSLVEPEAHLYEDENVGTFVSMEGLQEIRSEKTKFGTDYLSDPPVQPRKDWYRDEYVGVLGCMGDVQELRPSRLKSILFRTNIATLCELYLS